MSVIEKKRLVISHVGDSRAVIARKTPSGFQAVPLTRDHKLDIPEEKYRIRKQNG